MMHADLIEGCAAGKTGDITRSHEISQLSIRQPETDICAGLPGAVRHHTGIKRDALIGDLEPAFRRIPGIRWIRVIRLIVQPRDSQRRHQHLMQPLPVASNGQGIAIVFKVDRLILTEEVRCRRRVQQNTVDRRMQSRNLVRQRNLDPRARRIEPAAQLASGNPRQRRIQQTRHAAQQLPRFFNLRKDENTACVKAIGQFRNLFFPLCANGRSGLPFKLADAAIRSTRTHQPLAAQVSIGAEEPPWLRCQPPLDRIRARAQIEKQTVMTEVRRQKIFDGKKDCRLRSQVHSHRIVGWPIGGERL